MKKSTNRLFYLEIVEQEFQFYVDEMDQLISVNDDGHQETVIEGRELATDFIEERIKRLHHLLTDIKSLSRHSIQ